ncbi:MAG: orotidine-5'-phosphate decarboxylase [Anaerolineaceae bacterium 4572_32.2]|nr:MAG: orotidine-5'-phosphate decarboxylase [Anaerolineaceae bacterium 4572_32.2]HEY72913.1 orotidine-5'-phosphate decarboxylase [Thermoflexia bacterium]
MTFIHKLKMSQQTNNSWLCVGLDPVLERLPEAVLSAASPLLAFARAIVEATADLACAYKPNLAFWLAEGPAGLRALQTLVAAIPDYLPVILDAKFNDIGHTAAAYARAAFEMLGVDACTANPYLGLDGPRPFLEWGDRGIFLLARTSNPSAPDLQDCIVDTRLTDGRLADGCPLYEEVARLANRWDAQHPGACGLVVGATYPDELARLREIAPDLPFLIPGVGAQGGDLAAAVTHGPTTDGLGPVINSSRGIIYASSGPDFAESARAVALILRDQINQVREANL